MTTDERELVQASIEQLTSAINSLSRTLMLDSVKHPNTIHNYLMKSGECIKKANNWLGKIKV